MLNININSALGATEFQAEEEGKSECRNKNICSTAKQYLKIFF